MRTLTRTSFLALSTVLKMNPAFAVKHRKERNGAKEHQ
jgi:hypothetical protein